VAELTLAELYAPSAPVALRGHLDALDFASGVYWSDASWTIAITLTSSNGRSLAAREIYSFAASYGADAGCQNTAHALMPAVQSLVGKLVRDPGFSALIR
jgi:hypothetical protein